MNTTPRQAVTLAGMPGRGTPRRGIRIPDELWERAGAGAQQVGSDRNTVIRDLLRWWLREPGAQLPPRPDPPGVDQIP